MQPLPLTPEPCRCPTPEAAKLCNRAGHPMNAREWALCSHTQQPGLPPISAASSDAYRRKWDGLPGADKIRARLVRCQYRSPEPTGWLEVFSCCGASEKVEQYGCACPERAATPTTTLRGCLACDHHKPITGYVRQRGDPKVGLVIGSCGYPNLVELQIRAARLLCGETLPVLISDDTDDAAKVERLHALTVKYPNVALWRNAVKAGHAPGDVVALWKGLQWSRALDLRVMIKVSNRLLWLTPRWAQDAAAALLKSGKVWASMPCLQGHMRFAFRSEAIALDVLQAARPDVLAALEPQRLADLGTWAPDKKTGMVAETFLWELFQARGWAMHEWEALGAQRYESRAPALLWHCADATAAYERAAAEYGVDLGGERPGMGG